MERTEKLERERERGKERLTVEGRSLIGFEQEEEVGMVVGGSEGRE